MVGLYVLICCFTGCSLPDDFCPDDPNKKEPGVCGCGVPEDNADNDDDTIPNCLDTCKNDKNKSFFIDEDGIFGSKNEYLKIIFAGHATGYECIYHPMIDPERMNPNQCGCGESEADTDGDGIADCKDECPEHAAYILEPHCGNFCEELDRDGDGIADCEDLCPDDPHKSTPGKCGCGIDDSTFPACDECLGDPDKYRPGICGCGVPDIDSDGDTVLDCLDVCPNNSLKKTEDDIQLCGCDYYDRPEDISDDDDDGYSNCKDVCPNNPTKWANAGVSGCDGLDTDKDGYDDSIDGCPTNPNIHIGIDEVTDYLKDCNIYDEETHTLNVYNAKEFGERMNYLHGSGLIINIMNDINLDDLGRTGFVGDECFIENDYIDYGPYKIYGNGHKVYAVHEDQRCPLRYPLFGASVYSLEVHDVVLDYDVQTYSDYDEYVGLLTGLIVFDLVALSNITINGTISTNTSRSVGGLVGNSDNKMNKLESISGNISISAPMGYRVGGLLGSVRQNAVLEKINLTIDELVGYRNVGGLCGSIIPINSIDVSDVDVSDIIIKTSFIDGDMYIGGLFGSLESSSISLSNVRAYHKNLRGLQHLGGMIGSLMTKELTIENSVNLIDNIAGCAIAGMIADAYFESINFDNIINLSHQFHSIAQNEYSIITDSYMGCYYFAMYYDNTAISHNHNSVTKSFIHCCPTTFQNSAS